MGNFMESEKDQRFLRLQILRTAVAGAVNDGKMITLLNLDPRVIGIDFFEPSIDIRRDGRLTALINFDGTDRLELATHGLLRHRYCFDICEAALGRFDRDGKLIEVCSTGRCRRQRHPTNRTVTKSRLPNLWMHGASVDSLSRSNTGRRLGLASRLKPTDTLRDSQQHDQMPAVSGGDSQGTESPTQNLVKSGETGSEWIHGRLPTQIAWTEGIAGSVLQHQAEPAGSLAMATNRRPGKMKRG